MSQTKVQLIAPIGIVTASTVEITGVVTATTLVGDIAGTVTGITSTTDNLDVGIVTATAFVGDFTGTASSIVTGSNVTAGIITGTKFIGNATGTVSGLADDTNINVGILTSTSFVGDLTGNAAGLSTTTANLSLGIVTATSFAGNITGNAAGISVTTTNANLGIITASAFHGSGANLNGVSAGPVSQQAVTANSSTTTIDLSSGNVIYMTQTADTTVAFASTEGNTDTVYLIRKPDGTARTLTWPSGMVWNGGSEPTLAYGASDFQVFKLTTRDNGATWYGSIGAEDTFKFGLYVWGGNGGYGGQLGQNQGEAQLAALSSPVQIPGIWTSGDSDGMTVVAFKEAGTLWTWGSNSYGQLGQSQAYAQLKTLSSPVQIPGTTWSKANMVQSFFTATKTDGTLWVMGQNERGQLGQNNLTRVSSPTQVPGTTWSKVHNGGNYVNGGVKTDGTLWLWGQNVDGSLGQNESPSARYGYSSPVQIPGTTWNYTSGGNSIAALKTDGTLWAWGFNDVGDLGVNDTTRRSSPTQIPGTTWKEIASTTYGHAAIKTDGTLWAWGYNYRGEMGINSRTPYSSPKQIPGTTWNELRGINNYGYAATKTDGTLWVWGQGSSGGLGQNQPGNTHYSSPVQVGTSTKWSLNGISKGGRGQNTTFAFVKEALN